MQIKITDNSKKCAFLTKSVNRFFCGIIFLAIALAVTPLKAQIENDLYGEQSGNLAGVSSLMSAVSSNDVEGVKFFSRAGGFIINQKNIGGATALHIAARNGNDEITKILLDNGSDTNITDNEGWTALMRAAINGNAKITAALCDKGADASIINSDGNSVLIHAALADCSDCLNAIFTKSNLIKVMDSKLLKEQLIDAFIVARNRDNQATQKLLEGYLDYINKSAPLVSKPSSVASGANSNNSESGETKIIGGDLQSNIQQNTGTNGIKYKFKSAEDANALRATTSQVNPVIQQQLSNAPLAPTVSPIITAPQPEEIATKNQESSNIITSSNNEITNKKVIAKFKFITGQPAIILPKPNKNSSADSSSANLINSSSATTANGSHYKFKTGADKLTRVAPKKAPIKREEALEQKETSEDKSNSTSQGVDIKPEAEVAPEIEKSVILDLVQ